MDFEERMTRFEAGIGYAFRDRTLLETALTHTSYVKGDGARGEHNERMEFLGDAVLELCVSEYLYGKTPAMSEGAMSRMRASLVCEKALYRAGCALGVPDAVRLGVGEERMGGREKSSVISDATEAVIGAVFLDGGIAPAKALIINRIVRALEESVGTSARDFKTRLQERLQKAHLGMPQYVLIDERGPAHAREFTMAVYLNGAEIGRGTGTNKRLAGEAAAEAALAAMKTEQH